MQKLRVGKRNKGFTLIEILVVMAISVVLMGLVLGPVVKSFELTRRAQAMVEAQDAARTALNRITRELGQAMFVYDNASVPATIYEDGTTSLTPYGGSIDGPIVLPVKMSGGVQGFVMPYAKIDFILPKITMHCNSPDHGDVKPRDYDRGNEAWPPCPVCGSDDVEARPRLPLEQDVTVVRYFLALRYNDPSPGANDPAFGWVSPWAPATEAGEGNQVVLYRAEFSPYDDKLFPKDMTLAERLLDPIFFYRDAENPDKMKFCDRWQQVSRVVGLGKYEDLITVTKGTNGEVTGIKPSITFRTSTINNDTFTGAYSSDKSNDYPDAVPAVFSATYGYWTPDFQVSVYRDDYTMAFSTEINSSGDLVVNKWAYSGGDPPSWNMTPHFNVSQYMTTGEIVNMTDPGSPVEMAFTVSENSGKINFALQPPGPGGKRTTGPICQRDSRDIVQINDDYHALYQSDRIAIRSDKLDTFRNYTGNPQYQPNARVVPGSEQVIGPDMTPNAPAGKLVRYERVPLALGDAGLNQYKIDYDTGEVFFSPIWDQDIPAWDGAYIQYYYKIQFNKPDDVVRGDYSTKSLITIDMQIRMYDPESAKVHTVDLHDSVKVRNALR